MPLGRLASRSTIELGLRDDPLRAIRGVLDRALALLGDVAAARQGGGDVVCELQECRHLIALPAPAGEIEAACTRSLEACGEFLAQPVEAESADREALMALVRETMATVSNTGQHMGAGVHHATGGFDALLKITDLGQLKAGLASELAAFRQAMTTRRQAFDDAVQTYQAQVAELEAQLRRGHDESAIDALTGLANRGAFDRTTHGLAGLPDARFSIALIDIDGLRGINLEHGNLAGDRILLGFAQALKGSVRADDLVARHGGDQFAVLMRDVAARQAEARVANAIAAFSHARLTADDGRAVIAHVSAGIVEFTGGHHLPHAIERATAAIAEAKRSGGNRLIVRTLARHLVGVPSAGGPH